MRNFPNLTDGDLRDMLADVDRDLGDMDRPHPYLEDLAWEIEEELHRRHLEAMEQG